MCRRRTESPTGATGGPLVALRGVEPGKRVRRRLYRACGIEWDKDDIARFLSKCKWKRLHDRAAKAYRQHLVYTGGRSRGQGNKQWYGSFWAKGKTVRAHKFYAVAILGLRPGPGDELDHTCYNTRCVSCLECVPRAVNQARIRRGARNGAVSQPQTQVEMPPGEAG